MLVGLADSEAHPENGMTREDMEACAKVADTLGEVIIFRSTGPWAKRWLEQKPPFPSKNFHVKGKSSNWGPHAGFVPYLGKYSKVGADPEKAAAGTKANDKGLAHSQFALKSQLALTAQQINTQLTQVAEGRLAIKERIVLPNGNMILRANRTGDEKMFSFFAKKTAGAEYPIFVFREDSLLSNPHFIMQHDPNGNNAEPLLIMGSAEVGAQGRAMTGDYDLLAVCPPLKDRFSQVTSDPHSHFRKDDIHLFTNKASTARGLEFRMGMGMDNVLDGRLHTGSDHRKWMRNPIGPVQPGREYDEHEDLGNVTPRILRCINMLNMQMGAVGANGWARRVHHNAESHRYIDFGALKRGEMAGKSKEGFPFSCFLPSQLTTKIPTRKYGTICTLENMDEFEKFAQHLEGVDYWVPTNFTWGMKSRIATKMQRTIQKFENMAAQNGGTGFRGR